MKTDLYEPKVGDVVKVWFGSSVGSEQRDYRLLVIVITHIIKDELVLVTGCSITTKAKGLAMEVPFALDGKQMVALAGHINTIDPRAAERKVKLLGKMPSEELANLRLKIVHFLGQ